ncbi:hypothetical protein [Thermococcus celer]|uniref:Uncharacterized protein n=1 Tax=Thermococcus celer Vu 13 = JCM 8558 TaxID=1293037 RepID=A0A218P318_THECE|nr:hypothetical protein [Thermococcus celer]ASI99313.1 hypothetical protein A3L02_06945 [Thermococcus celer Vu 13 = JCM 8558]
MIKERVCREYLEEIDRLERSIRELEEEITELRMQLRLKVDEANSLAIENRSLRHKLELMERREERLVEFLRKVNLPLVLVDEENFEDVDVDLGPDLNDQQKP